MYPDNPNVIRLNRPNGRKAGCYYEPMGHQNRRVLDESLCWEWMGMDWIRHVLTIQVTPNGWHLSSTRGCIN